MNEHVALSVCAPHLLARMPRNTAVLLAFSGGADSAALLHLLVSMRESDGFSLTVAHVNHGIRGEEAIRDRDFCVALANRYGVESCVLNADVPTLARKCGQGIEETAREVRYEYFERLMRERNIPILVTAHHADDNLETVLFRMSRGTGLRGLGGIAPTRPFADGMLVRPLLGVTRREILDYCEENDIPFVTDSTNADTAYARNRIRADVIPALEGLFPGAARRAMRMTEELRLDEEYLSSLASELLESVRCPRGLQIKGLADAPIPLRRRVLARFAQESCRVGIEAVHAEALEALCIGQTPRAEVALPHGRIAFCEDGVLLIREGTALETKLPTVHLPLSLGVCDVGVTGIRVFAEKCGNEIKVHNLSTAPYIILKGDFDIIKGSLYWRCREAGDLLLMGGMHRKLRRLQAQAGIDVRMREKIPLLCDAEGIVWAPFVGVRDGVACMQSIDADGVCVGLLLPDF